MSDADLKEKSEFFSKVMDAIVEAGYADPGFYIDEYAGQPCIFGPDDTPRQSVAGDSPIQILRDFCAMLDDMNY